jgi:hypothetical protein
MTTPHHLLLVMLVMLQQLVMLVMLLLLLSPLGMLLLLLLLLLLLSPLPLAPRGDLSSDWLRDHLRQRAAVEEHRTAGKRATQERLGWMTTPPRQQQRRRRQQQRRPLHPAPAVREAAEAAPVPCP